MFNRSLVIRMLGNGYLALVGLAILFAGFLSTIALIEVDQLGETGEGLLHAAYETLNCFGTVSAAWVFAIVLVVAGLGLLVYAALRLYDNAYEAKFPPRTNNPSPPPNDLL